MIPENNSVALNAMQDDKTGFAEMAAAFEKIEKLKKNSVEAELPSSTPEQQNEPQENEKQEEVTEDNEHHEEEEDNDVELQENESAKKDPKKDEPKWKIKRDKFKILAEKNAILYEMEALREAKEQAERERDDALNSGVYHYSQNAYFHLEQAKALQKEAMTRGDYDAFIEAGIAITNATQTINEVKNWGYNDKSQRVNQPQYTAPPKVSQQAIPDNYNDIYEDIGTAWLDTHDYLQSESKNYDPQLAQQVIEYSKSKDADLARKNRKHEIFSESYFDDIDNYIEQIKNPPQRYQKNIATGAPIGGVKNSFSSAGNNKFSSTSRITLNAEEKKMARNMSMMNMGVSEADWLKAKINRLKKGNNND